MGGCERWLLTEEYPAHVDDGWAHVGARPSIIYATGFNAPCFATAGAWSKWSPTPHNDDAPAITVAICKRPTGADLPPKIASETSNPGSRTKEEDTTPWRKTKTGIAVIIIGILA